MTDALREAVAARDWYHTLELAPGVVTPGWFDLRPVAPRLPWPDLTGKRCLDVGTFDGFWAFEMERRGAAEVVAADILDPLQWDWPAGAENCGGRGAQGRGPRVRGRARGARVRSRAARAEHLRPRPRGAR